MAAASLIIDIITNEDTLTDKQKALIGKLFDTLEMAHNQLARDCGVLGMLSCVISSQQLLIVLKPSIRPLIQVNALPGFLDKNRPTQMAMDIPDNKIEQIRTTMTPDAKSQYIRGEKINSLTRLLAATFTFKLLNKFGDGVTQRKMQETYEVQAKQLATCINRVQILGSTDKKVLV